MVEVPIICPNCQTDDIVKHGFSTAGKQRYYCRNKQCSRKVFILKYTNKGHLPIVKKTIVDMAINGSGIRDTARVLEISPLTVISTLKKKNPSLLT